MPDFPSVCPECRLRDVTHVVKVPGKAPVPRCHYCASGFEMAEEAVIERIAD